jgi:hypothetical protein
MDNILLVYEIKAHTGQRGLTDRQQDKAQKMYTCHNYLWSPSQTMSLHSCYPQYMTNYRPLYPNNNSQ